MHSISKTIAGVVLAAVTIIGSASAAEATVNQSFSDVAPEAPYYTAVAKMTDVGLMRGNGKGAFEPSRSVTRGELYQVLAAACGAETGEQDGHWAGKAAAYLRSGGLIPEGAVDYDSSVNRAEAISLIYRTFANGFSDLKTAPVVRDKANIPEEYQADVEGAYQAGIVPGTPSEDGTVLFFPCALYTRADLAVILDRTGLSFPVDRDADTRHAAVEFYTADKSGFSATDKTTEVPAVQVDGRYYYDLDAAVELAGLPVSAREERASEVFLVSNSPKVPSKSTFFTVDGQEVELHGNRLLMGQSFVSGNDQGDDCLTLGSKTYVADAALSRILGYQTFADLDGTLRVLVSKDVYPGFIGRSAVLSDAEKENLKDALWLLYNADQEAYETVLNEIWNIEPATPFGTALAWVIDNGGRTVYWKTDAILSYTPQTNAGVLLHEVTHYQRFRLGDQAETKPVLAQGKVYYAMEQYGYPAKFGTGTIKWGDEYAEGVNAFREWMAE